MSYSRYVPFLLLLTLVLPASAQDPYAGLRKLNDTMATIAVKAQGKVGVNFYHVEANTAARLHADERFPMQSVYKFPLALYILNQVDKGKLSLDQPIPVDKKEWARMRSPMLDKYKKRHIVLPLREVLEATVGSSDNVGCDLLFRLAGGPSVVNKYIRGFGTDGINIVYTEMEMAADWKNQYENWCRPSTMNYVMEFLFGGIGGDSLSTPSRQLLLHWMTASTSPKRIQAKLPAGTIVAHKTGTSNTNAQGLTAATNDVGIVTLPDGSHLIIVVFVSDSIADQATREGVIADISLAGYEYFKTVEPVIIK